MSVDLRFHGDREAGPGQLDLAVNVARAGPPGWLAAELTAGVATLGSYPRPAAAVAALAAAHGRAADEVLPLAGAAEAFVLLARALRPRMAVAVHPSFTEPEAALRAAGHPVRRVLLAPPYQLDPALVPAEADLVVLGNPTNPTGVLHDAGLLASLARPGRVLVIDEAFADTVVGGAHSLAAARLPGLVVIRSLTKTWGLAGLRVGYLLGPAEVVARLAAAQPAWPVSSLALHALRVCSTPRARAEVTAYATELAGRRARLAGRLAALPGVALAAPSATSFLLLSVTGGARFRAGLSAVGVAVRRGETFPGLGPDLLRIAVPAEADLPAAIAAFETVAAERQESLR